MKTMSLSKRLSDWEVTISQLTTTNRWPEVVFIAITSTLTGCLLDISQESLQEQKQKTTQKLQVPGEHVSISCPCLTAVTLWYWVHDPQTHISVWNPAWCPFSFWIFASSWLDDLCVLMYEMTKFPHFNALAPRESGIKKDWVRPSSSPPSPLLTCVGMAELWQDTQLLPLLVQVLLEDGTLLVEQVTTLGVGRRVEHVQAAKEQVVRVDKVIIDLRILTCC